MNFETISANNLDLYIGKNGYEIIDLRNRLSFENSHIKGAVNIPFGELEGKLNTLPKNTTLIFYCNRGGQSLIACNELSKIGLKVLNVSGGLASYRGINLCR